MRTRALVPSSRTTGLDRSAGQAPRATTRVAGLRITEPDDPHEREADRMAARVMGMGGAAAARWAEGPAPRATGSGHSIGAVRSHADDGAPPAERGSSLVRDVIGSPGQALPVATRAFMEPSGG